MQSKCVYIKSRKKHGIIKIFRVSFVGSSRMFRVVIFRYSQVPNNHRDHRRRRGDTSGEHGHMPGASGGKAGGMKNHLTQLLTGE